MPRLFWKLFAAFWLTTLAILAVSIFASFRLADRSLHDQLDPREADAAVQELLEQGGLDAAIRWLNGRESFAPGTTVYLVDRNGRDLAQRALPPFVERRAPHMWRLAQRNARDPRPGIPRRRAFEPLVHSADGRQFIAIPGPAAPPMFGVLSTSGMRWTVLAAAAVISFLAFWWLSRSMSRPLQKMAATAAQLSAGHMSARVGDVGAGNDEIRQLAEQLDRMAQQVQLHSDRQSELFRNISHELRAPLARLEIAAELLERKSGAASEQIHRIRSEIRVLEALTNQVLGLARAGYGSEHREKIDLVKLLERIVDDTGYEAAARQVSVVLAGMPQFDTDMAPPGGANKTACRIEVTADPALLRSALENIVRNAVQAAPTGSEVAVTLTIADQRCEICITDAGPGVPDTELQRIFEPFYRLDQNRPGSGIGLAIASRVAALYGGSIRAINRQGGGLRVLLTLPLSSAEDLDKACNPETH